MAEKRSMCIYVITNKKNKKQYIGRTCGDVKNRLFQHFSDSKYVLNNCPLHKDMKTYKKEDFEINILHEFKCDNYYDADSIELDFMQKFDTFYPKGYNKRRVKREWKTKHIII